MRGRVSLPILSILALSTSTLTACGGPVTLFTAPENSIFRQPGSIAVDATSVYWANWVR